MGLSRFLLILFSLCLHGALAGTLMIFSAGGLQGEERVYHVSLAELAAPRSALPVSPEPASPAAAPEPEIPMSPVPEPEPAAEPKTIQPKKEEAKVISSKKSQKKEPAQKNKAESNQVQPQKTAAGTGSSGPQPSQIGGLAAYRASQVDQRPSISRRVAPEYPARAKRMNVEGRVVVQIVVDMSGLPKACKVQRAEPPGYFEAAALAAAEATRFIPGKIKGQPVNTLVLLPFAFQMR